MPEVPARAGPTALTAASQTIFTAGAAATYHVLRSIYVTNPTTGPIAVTVGIGTSDADTAAKRIASGLPLEAGQSVDLLGEGFIPLIGSATPDLLYALCSPAGATITLGMTLVS